MCPIVEARLFDGPAIDWDIYKPAIVVRCKGRCRAVYPADSPDDLDSKINPATGVCWECEAYNEPL